MKLIQIIKNKYCTEYFYENKITKRIYDSGEIYWHKYNTFNIHKEDGAANENCQDCLENSHSQWGEYKNIIFKKNKFNRHFGLKNNFMTPFSFAKETSHILCYICSDFCNQECFIG